MFRRRLIVPALIALIAAAFVVSTSFSKENKPKQFIGIFKVAKPDFIKNGPTAEEMKVVIEHRDYWQKYRDDGVCLLAGHTLNDDPIGLSVVIADSEAAAKQMMDADPMVKTGLLKVTLLAFEGLEKKK
jgi:uncharacterized protein YciI